MTNTHNRRLRRFFSQQPLKDLQQELRLSAEESRHFRTTLRLKAGDSVLLTDSLGREGTAVILGYQADGAANLRLAELGQAPAESRVFVRLCAALTQKGVTDELVEKASELGVEEFQPMITERTQVRMTSGSDRPLERWCKIACEAAKQSGRRKLLVIHEPLQFQEIVLHGAPRGSHVFFDPHTLGAVGLSEWLDSVRQKLAEESRLDLNLYFGPEGGFSQGELQRAQQTLHASGFSGTFAHLGARILKVDTAVVSVIAAVKILLT